jgi:hypothetical protein
MHVDQWGCDPLDLCTLVVRGGGHTQPKKRLLIIDGKGTRGHSPFTACSLKAVASTRGPEAGASW